MKDFVSFDWVEDVEKWRVKRKRDGSDLEGFLRYLDGRGNFPDEIPGVITKEELKAQLEKDWMRDEAELNYDFVIRFKSRCWLELLVSLASFDSVNRRHKRFIASVRMIESKGYQKLLSAIYERVLVETLKSSNQQLERSQLTFENWPGNPRDEEDLKERCRKIRNFKISSEMRYHFYETLLDHKEDAIAAIDDVLFDNWWDRILKDYGRRNDKVLHIPGKRARGEK